MKHSYFQNTELTERNSVNLRIAEILRPCLVNKTDSRFRNLLLYLMLILICLSCNGGIENTHTSKDKNANENQAKVRLHAYIEKFNVDDDSNRAAGPTFQKLESKHRLLESEGVINLTPEDISLLGTGFNSVTGELLAPQVIASPTISTDSNGGVEVQIIKANMATSYKELLSSMDVSGGASLGIKVFSASAKMEAMNTIHTSSSSSYLVYRTSIKSFSRELTKPTLSSDPDVKDIVRNYSRFFGFAGDEYVYRETFGGELYIVFAAEAYNSSEHTENKKSFSAATSFLNLGGSANINKAMTNISKTSNIQMYLYQKGGEGFSSKPDSSASVGQIFAYAQGFAKQVKGHSTLLSFDTKQYQTATGIPAGYQGYPPIRAYKHYMSSVIDKLQNISYLMGNVDFTTRNGTLFKPGFADSIARFNAPLKRQVDKLQACANQCRSEYSPLNCSQCAALHYDSVTYTLNLPATAPPANVVASSKADVK